MWLVRAIWLVVLVAGSLLFVGLLLVSTSATLQVVQEVLAKESASATTSATTLATTLVTVPAEPEATSAELKEARQLTEITANFAVVMTAVSVWATFLRKKWHDWYP